MHSCYLGMLVACGLHFKTELLGDKPVVARCHFPISFSDLYFTTTLISTIAYSLSRTLSKLSRTVQALPSFLLSHLRYQ